MGKYKVGIVGLPFWEIMPDPLNTLVGNRVRSWALFDGLAIYNIETHLFVEKDAEVLPEIRMTYGSRFITDPNEFVARARKEFDYVILCSTKLETLAEQQPWIRKIKNANLIGAFCYHNTPLRRTFRLRSLLDQMVAVAFVSPIHQIHWHDQKWTAPSFHLTTGQTLQSQLEKQDYSMDTVFVGELRSLEKLKLLCHIAEECPDRRHILVCPRIIEQREHNRVHLNFAAMPVDQHRPALRALLQCNDCILPDNLILDPIPVGCEKPLLDKVGIALDFSWNDRYDLENSKVPRYLSYGLIPLVEMPAPSHRYIDFFGIGEKVDFGRTGKTWANLIRSLKPLSLGERNDLRRKAGQFFSWNKVVFEIASIIYGLRMQEMHKESLPGKVLRKIRSQWK